MIAEYKRMLNITVSVITRETQTESDDFYCHLMYFDRSGVLSVSRIRISAEISEFSLNGRSNLSN